MFYRDVGDCSKSVTHPFCICENGEMFYLGHQSMPLLHIFYWVVLCVFTPVSMCTRMETFASSLWRKKILIELIKNVALPFTYKVT